MKRDLPPNLTVLALLALLTMVVLAQGGYRMTRSVYAGGGGFSVGGPYDLQGTIGQPVTGASNQGDYDVSSGFWGWIRSFFKMFGPLVLRDNPSPPCLTSFKNVNPSHARMPEQPKEAVL
jgi:hypothetical protein